MNQNLQLDLAVLVILLLGAGGAVVVSVWCRPLCKRVAKEGSGSLLWSCFPTWRRGRRARPYRRGEDSQSGKQELLSSEKKITDVAAASSSDHLC